MNLTQQKLESESDARAGRKLCSDFLLKKIRLDPKLDFNFLDNLILFSHNTQNIFSHTTKSILIFSLPLLKKDEW